MSTKPTATSIFTDDSGARKRTVTLAIRGAVGLIGLGVAAVAVSVFGHVTLPGLEAPLHISGIDNTNPAAKVAKPGTVVSTDGSLPTGQIKSTTPTAKPASVAKSTGPTPGNSASTAQPTAPTTPRATPTTRATGKPTSKPTTAATPTHGAKPIDPGQSHSKNST